MTFLCFGIASEMLVSVCTNIIRDIPSASKLWPKRCTICRRRYLRISYRVVIVPWRELKSVTNTCSINYSWRTDISAYHGLYLLLSTSAAAIVPILWKQCVMLLCMGRLVDRCTQCLSNSSLNTYTRSTPDRPYNWRILILYDTSHVQIWSFDC